MYVSSNIVVRHMNESKMSFLIQIQYMFISVDFFKEINEKKSVEL